VAITFTCTCGKQVAAADHLAGKHARCPACGARQVVPDDPVLQLVEDPINVEFVQEETEPASSSHQKKSPFRCPKCGNIVQQKIDFAGQRITCSVCNVLLEARQGTTDTSTASVPAYDLIPVLPTPPTQVNLPQDATSSPPDPASDKTPHKKHLPKKFRCPECKCMIRHQPRFLGRLLRCPSCRSLFLLLPANQTKRLSPDQEFEYMRIGERISDLPFLILAALMFAAFMCIFWMLGGLSG